MKIIITGALGRMGQKLTDAISKTGHEIAAFVDISYGECGGEREYGDINAVSEEADVIIDFSHHSYTACVLDYAARREIPAVIATTGHTGAEKDFISSSAEKIPVFYSQNMSLGIATLCDTVKKVLSVFTGADVEIVETHHNNKLDAPSGTAKMLFDSIKEVRPDAVMVCGRSGYGKREKNEVGISSVRVGGIVGIHEVIIGTESEQIVIRHEAYDRALFADGAIKAAEYIKSKAPGLYSMKNLLAEAE